MRMAPIVVAFIVWLLAFLSSVVAGGCVRIEHCSARYYPIGGLAPTPVGTMDCSTQTLP